MLCAAATKSVFHPILEDIHIHRDRNLADSIPRGLNVQEHYRHNSSFHRCAEKQALENGVKENVMNFVHRWSDYKGSKRKQPCFNMLEHYAKVANTRYLQLSFINSLWYVRM